MTVRPDGRRLALQYRHLVELGGHAGVGAGPGRASLVGSWLAKADPVAALVVAVIVVQVSWRLARQTVDSLLDAAPVGVRAESSRKSMVSTASWKLTGYVSGVEEASILLMWRWRCREP